MLRRHLGRLAAASALCVGAALAAADDTWLLRRRVLQGARQQVEEEQDKQYDYRVTLVGQNGDPTAKTSGTGHAIERKQRRYVQVVSMVTGDGQYHIDRRYEKSSAEVSKPGTDRKDTYATRLQGKSVSIVGYGDSWDITADNFELGDEERQDIYFSEQLYTLLPKKPVRVGEQWSLRGNEVGPAFFPNEYNEEGYKIKATGLLKQVTKYQERNCAHIAFTLSVEIQKTEVSAGQSYDMKGYAFFSLDDGVFLDVDLVGPLRIEEGFEGGNRFKAEGSWHLKLKSKILARGEAATKVEDGGQDPPPDGGEPR